MALVLDDYLELLEQGYFEVTIAFEGLDSTKLWRRPAAGLLSIGEIAGHIAYGEAVRLACEDPLRVVPSLALGEEIRPDLRSCTLTSPLLDERFAYYPQTLSTAPTAAQLALSTEQVATELVRIHNAAVAHLLRAQPELDAPLPGWSLPWTCRETLKYLIFHIGYHTGQLFSVRHLLGDTTTDN